MALSDNTKKGIFLSKLLRKLWYDNIKKVCVLTHNRGSINRVFHNRTKHIAIKHHFIRDALKNRYIDADFVPTENMGK